ncbi:MAG TPA: bifunctional 5,10-methylenetetrahydrofolate dehydrogenase/5,10-methenyltetrahydrofolate cyclohydrolase [Candidatus Cloacimonetes bacterium]|jgi:methylenetetrahydrofolate dehydrogenase (NADP+)/methenyltetrahydrofolate cyclohydrolase|nr:bifunctional 5,10-methylene-tetrahydrofolate dehydrogenase/5,10-methylene-tetrahydrofolate cyclohydrolase [Candidatus Cloacimonas sp.]HHZ15370.1 bifunctional 5,10-methylenetetrahydrofolate dehydrogenase/5,10-methenyltetrahydrofolate cyclohydrolase [Candidatus Cloacimonadota bacterium]
MSLLLSGKPVADKIKDYLKERFQALETPATLKLIQVKGDPASGFYVKNIVRNGKRLGAVVDLVELEEETTTQELLKIIHEANDDPSVHGIMVQEPLPAHIDVLAVDDAIDPYKDIDALNPRNMGHIMLGINSLTPCTPTAVYALLRYYKIPTQGEHVVIIGRSDVVGKPLANMLLCKAPMADATVTVLHSKSNQLKELTRQADILVSAVGRPGFVTEDMIGENTVIIDVGINEQIDAEGKVSFVGDVDFNACVGKALAITPVPGGIGTITSAIVFLNLLRAVKGVQKDNKTIDDFLTLIFIGNNDE